MDISNGKSQDNALMPLVVIALLIVAFHVTSGFVIAFSFDSWGDRGTFGDMFGATNALFSGLALAGVVYAILLQRYDLRIQQQELILTRKEVTKSALSLAIQAKLQTRSYLKTLSADILLSTQTLIELEKNSSFIEQWIRDGKEPDAHANVIKFCDSFEKFMNQSFGTISYLLGPEENLSIALKALQVSFWDAKIEGNWNKANEVITNNTSIKSLLQKTRSTIWESYVQETLVARNASEMFDKSNA